MQPVPPFDLYAELEVSDTATTPTIEAAWRSLMKRNHPDLVDSAAAVRTVRLNVAHDWLTDPALRARYDADRTAAGRQPDPRASEPARSARSPAGDPPPRPPRHPPKALDLGGVSGGRPYRGGRDWRRASLIVVAALAVIGAVRSLFFVGEFVESSRSSEVAALPTNVVVSQPAVASSGTGARLASIQPSQQRASPSFATVLEVSLSGAGNRNGVHLTLAAGTYQVSYSVSSAKAGSCTWSLYVTDSDGYENLMASAYPSEETIRDAETDPAIAAGPATARVESDCPRWSASIKWVGA